MTIELKNNALSNSEKLEAQLLLDQYVSRYVGTFPKKNYDSLMIAIDSISKSKHNNVRELSIYLRAIVKYLNLENERGFFRKGQHRLLGSLRVFYEVEDVIPDTIPDRGFLDDIYCVNLAIKAQSKPNRDKIERIVSNLKRVDI